MLSNFEIADIFQAYRVPLTFIGMKNELPKKVSNGSYIINLESAPLDGSHWVALVVRGNDAFYFDSYGAYPPTDVVRFVKRRKICKMAFNQSIIQDLRSECCGYFASAILIYIAKHPTGNIYHVANSFIEKFKDETKDNTDILKKIYDSFSTYHPPLITRLDRQKV